MLPGLVGAEACGVVPGVHRGTWPAELQRPEWVEEDEEMGMEWERWARAQLSAADWQRRISVTLQRGNARVLRSGVLRARSGVGVRVYGRMGGCTLDVGTGD